MSFDVGEFVHVNLGEVLATDPDAQTFNAVFTNDHGIGATVRPTIWPGLRAARSNSTSTVLPIAARLKADCWLSINSWSRTNRSSISVADTVSRMSAAGVPGRGEYLNE